MFTEKIPFIEKVEAQVGDGWHIVPAERLVETCRTLRNEYKFDCLSCVTAVDKGAGIFDVVYHIFSYSRKETLVLKVLSVTEVPTVSTVWPSANWMEREAFDLFGVNFKNHPDLRRILLPEDWSGHPMRKDYQEQPEYNGMSTTR